MTRHIQQLFLVILIALASTFAAHAQSIMTPAYNWSGWYAGLNAGAAWGNAEISWISHQGNVNVNNQINQISQTTFTPVGLTGGAQAGFNFQTGNAVAGAEADFDFNGLEAQRAFSYTGVDRLTDSISQTMKSNWLATLRAKFGIAAGLWLLYADAGVALAHLQYSDYELFGNGQIFSASSSEVKTGLAAGAGTEYAFAPRWSAKVEYLYVNFGSTVYTSVGSNNPNNTIENHHIFVEQIARAGVNYHFN